MVFQNYIFVFDKSFSFHPYLSKFVKMLFMKKITFFTVIIIISVHLFANQIWQQMTGPYGGSIKTMIFFNGNYYASCELNQNYGGVWKLLSNNNWTNISNGLPKPYASSFAQIDTILFAASDTSVMKTINGGLTWIDASGNLPNNTWVRKLAVHNNILFASIYYGTGVEELFYSSNLGSTWVSTGFSLMSSFNQIFSYQNKLWLATNYGVYLSTNNGLNWTTMNNNIPFSANVYSIIAKGDTLYCGSSNGVYYSTNGANLWMQATNGLPAGNTMVNSFAIAGNYCYAATQSYGVYSTFLGSNNWTVSGSGLPQYTNVNIIVSANNSLVIGTFDGFYLNNPIGGVWTLINTGLNCSYVRSVYAEGNKIIASIGTNAGLYISTNGGNSWIQCSIANNIYVKKIIKVLNNLFAVTADGIYISHDGGYSWTISNSGITGSVNCITYTANKYFVGASNGLFQSITGNNWTQVTSVPTQSVNDIAASGNIIYFILGSQKVYTSNNSGVSWQNQSYGIPVTTPFLQSIVLSDSMAVISSLYGIYRKTYDDTTWTNPNPYQTNIDLLAVSGRHLFATSSSNVLVSNDFGKSWYGFNEGISPNIGSKISISIYDSIVYFGSETGGLWKRNISPELSVNNISGMPFCSGGSITVSMSTNASFNQGNKFYIQLSDKMGRFTNPLKIDSIVSNVLPISKTSTLPSNLEQGNFYRIRVVSTNPFVISKEYNADIVVNQKVNIQIHPANQSTCIGGNSGFYCGATGSGITYQWQVDDGSGFVNLINNSVYQGVNTEMLMISGITLAMNGYKFRCLVSGYCPPSLVSNFGILNVGLAPNILLQPSDTNVCLGSQAKFVVQASGSNITYQWQCDNGTGIFSNLSNNSTYSGVTTSTLTVSNSQINMNGYRYRCLLSSCLPTNSAYLNIITAPVIATLSNVTACLNNIAVFNAVVTGVVASYQWQVNTGTGFINIYNGTEYTGTDSSTLIVNNVTNSMNGYQYRCLITTYCSPYYYQTNSAALIVNPNSPTITIQPQSISVCENNSAIFTTSATGLGLSYQWQYKYTTSWLNVQNFSPFSGVNDDTLKIDTTKIVYNGYKFRCLISSCIFTDSAILTVNSNPNVSLTPNGNLTFCSGDSVLLYCNYFPNWVYNWFKDNQPIINYHSNSFTAHQTGNYKVEVIDQNGCKNISPELSVTTIPLPFINLGNDTSICNNESLILNAGSGFSNYLWSNGSIAQTIVVNSSNFGLGNNIIWTNVTDINGCSNSDTIVVNILNCTDIGEISNTDLRLFPNPLKDNLFIEFPAKTFNIKILSVDGKIMFYKKNENSNMLEINTKEFNPGVYFIKIKSDNDFRILKIIKL